MQTCLRQQNGVMSMKMKATLALLLVAAICVGVFISCTGSQTPDVPTVTPPDVTDPVVSDTITYVKAGSIPISHLSKRHHTGYRLTIENATFEDSLVINAAAQGGTITLKNVTIKGKLAHRRQNRHAGPAWLHC